MKRTRMILEIPLDIQRAIKMVAASFGAKTGDVIAEVIRVQYPRCVRVANKQLDKEQSMSKKLKPQMKKKSRGKKRKAMPAKGKACKGGY